MNISSKLPRASTWWKEACIEDLFVSLFSSAALGLDDVIGNFEVGKEFDALLINTKASDSPFDLFSADNFEVIRTGLMIQTTTGSDVGKVCGTARISLLRLIPVTGIGGTTPLPSVFQPKRFSGLIFLESWCPQWQFHIPMSKNACFISPSWQLELAICSDKWQPRKSNLVLVNTLSSNSKMATCSQIKARLHWLHCCCKFK